MSVYMIAEIKVEDETLYAEYVEKVRDIIEKHGGRYLVRGGAVTPFSGNWNPARLVIIEFEASEQVRRCFSSSEYLELAPLREQSTVSRAIVVDGV
ncbi:MAG: DUF1330 domain-containing protein [Anaerolineae bacterium]|nr:DUF1330 domain-containing protein [Anaerolineae bacterium]